MFLAQAEGEAWPDLSDEALAANPAWLAPFLIGKTRLDEIGADDLAGALDAMLPWDLKRRLDDEAPTHFRAPTGTQAPIDYDTEGGPAIALRVQELFGLNTHPSLAGGRIPLTLHLLSPANRPIQITRDLPGFWRGSWAAVRSDLRGRYPRHFWPEDPAAAAPTATREAAGDVRAKRPSRRLEGQFQTERFGDAEKSCEARIASLAQRAIERLSRQPALLRDRRHPARTRDRSKRIGDISAVARTRQRRRGVRSAIPSYRENRPDRKALF